VLHQLLLLRFEQLGLPLLLLLVLRWSLRHLQELPRKLGPPQKLLLLLLLAPV